MRHLKTAPGLPRVRLQNPSALPRNRLHPPGRHRRIEAARDHPESGRLHQGAQAEGPGDLRLGDPGQAPIRRSLRQVQRALGELHKPDTEKQDRIAGASVSSLAFAVQHDLSQLSLPPAEAAVSAAPAAVGGALLA